MIAAIATLWMTVTMMWAGYQPTVFIKYHPKSKLIEARLDSKSSAERDAEIGHVLMQLGERMLTPAKRF